MRAQKFLSFLKLSVQNKYEYMAILKIGIVEDEVIIADTIMAYLIALGYEVVFNVLSFEEAIDAIEINTPDFVLLDINLGREKNGIDLGKVLNEDYNLPFIFLTANSDMATLQKAKLVKPLGFLVKPFSKNGLYSSIEIAMDNFETITKAKGIESDYLLVNNGERFTKIKFDDICYFENNTIHIVIYLKDGSTETTKGIFSEILLKLPKDQFSQISRMHIVNHQYIHKVNKENILVGTQVLPISRNKKRALLLEEDGSDVNMSSIFTAEYRQIIAAMLVQYISLEKYLLEDCAIADLAAFSSISIHHLSYYFNNILHIKYTDWRNNCRIDYSVLLLKEGEMNKLTLKGIAKKSGFSSQSTFIRAFKFRTGMAPSTYKQI